VRLRFVLLPALLAAAVSACQSTEEPYVDVGVESGRCAACHLSDYASVERPVHAGVKPTTCGVCHSQDAWQPAILNHSFALTGAHAKADCLACHRGTPPVFQGTASSCVGCHRSDYDRSRFPGHSRFPLTCAECHSTSAWKPALEERKPEPAPVDDPAPPAPAPQASVPPARQERPKPAPRAVRTGASAPAPQPRATPSLDTVTGASRHR